MASIPRARRVDKATIYVRIGDSRSKSRLISGNEWWLLEPCSRRENSAGRPAKRWGRGIRIQGGCPTITFSPNVERSQTRLTVIGG